jgi:hypothetical protein
LGIKITSIGLGDSTWGNAAALTDVVATSFIKHHLSNYGTQMYKIHFTFLYFMGEAAYMAVETRTSSPSLSKLISTAASLMSFPKLLIRQQAKFSSLAIQKTKIIGGAAKHHLLATTPASATSIMALTPQIKWHLSSTALR